MNKWLIVPVLALILISGSGIANAQAVYIDPVPAPMAEPPTEELPPAIEGQTAMAQATNAQLIDALELSGETVTGAQLTRLQAMYNESQTFLDENGDPRSVEAEDVFKEWHAWLKARVLAHEKAKQTVTW